MGRQGVLKSSVWVMVFFAVFSIKSFSQNEDLVRIGLIHRHNVQDLYRVDSKDGLVISFIPEGSYQKDNPRHILHTHPLAESLTVMKDVRYSVKEGTVQIEGTGTNQKENWYISVGEALNREDEERFMQYLEMGLEGFKMFDGAWSFVLGPFNHFEEVLFHLNRYREDFPELEFQAVDPNPIRLLVLDAQYKPLLLFDLEGFELFMAPIGDSRMRMNENPNKIYRGIFSGYRLQNGNLILVNILPVEEYLYGVVPYEIGGNSPLEAVKAQAVAARNYTYNNMAKYASEKFNLCDTVYSQVYGGVLRETENSNRGVDETRGKLLKYNGQNAAIFYFSSTGGERTEDVKNVWGSSIPYLTGVESAYESPTTYNYTWTMERTGAQVRETLARRNINVGTVVDIKVAKRSEAGRVIELQVIGTSGSESFLRESARTIFNLASQHYEIKTDNQVSLQSAKESSSVAVGSLNLLSAKGMSKVGQSVVISNGKQAITRSASPQNFVFEGKGWGHAVGLSQNGAIGMARAGYTYDKILTHYFPGTVVE
jgi:stage II sporulation protein D